MTQIRRRLGDYVTSRFLNSAMVLGQEGPAVVTHVGEEEVRDDKQPGGKRLAIMVTFDRWPDKALDLNVTNIRAFQDMYGEDVEPDSLRGARVHVGTHQTNFGRGVLISPLQDTVQHASAHARQQIADSMARQGLTPRSDHPLEPLPPAAPPVLPPAGVAPVMVTHLHQPGEVCNPRTCPVPQAVSRGENVYESWPEIARPMGVPSNPPPPSNVAPGEYDPQDPGAQRGPGDDIPF